MSLKRLDIWAALGMCSIAGGAKADIVGGEAVSPRDPIRSSTAALFSPSKTGQGGALCTASIIGNDMALTAAHCIEPGAKPVLLFGNDLHSPDTVKRAVSASAVNPLYQTRSGRGMDEGDIALVKFAGGLPQGYQTVDRLKSEAGLTQGQSAILAGYGIDNARTHEGAGKLRKTEVKIANPRSGKSEMILDQAHGHGACHGDSGGPAFIRQNGKMVLAGVTNRSYPASAPDDCAHKVVYTKVDAYQPWIDETEKKLRASSRTTASNEMRMDKYRLRKKMGTHAMKVTLKNPLRAPKHKILAAHYKRKAHPKIVRHSGKRNQVTSFLL